MEQRESHARMNESKWTLRAETYDESRFDYFRLMQKYVLRYIERKPGVHFLDVGCGTGWAVCHLAESLQYLGEFYGIDLSIGMVEKASLKSEEHSNIHFIQANVEQIPIEDNFFDYVISTNSFHHYLDPSKALCEVRRILKPHGRILIMDPTADDLLMRWIDRRVKKNEPEHVKFYSSKEYQTMFEEAKVEYIQRIIFTSPMKIHVGEKRD